ncbi:MAG: AGE family epimerase/isomerase [Bacillota bacterium]|nr:AGE family epimerase/isomerase [Bacillota bacterium]
MSHVSLSPIAPQHPASVRMATEMHNDLVERILPFWTGMRDDEKGGFHGAADAAGVIIEGAPRSLVLMSRILWTYAEAARYLGDPELLDHADHAAAYLDRHFVTPDGGACWNVSPDGEVLDSRQLTYGLSFLLYAYATHAIALRELSADRCEAIQHAETQADRVFRFIHTRCWNGDFMAESAAPAVGEEAGFETPFANQKNGFSMNTHLHVLESVTRYLLMRADPAVEALLLQLVTICRHRIYNAGTRHLDLYMDPAGRHLTDIASFGHDIEYSWLLIEAIEILAAQSERPDGYAWLLEAAKKEALDIADFVLRHGRHPSGAVANEGYEDRIVHPETIWWTQAEAIVGFVNAWQLGGDEAYLDAAVEVWNYVRAQMLDPSGEWLSCGRDMIPPASPTRNATLVNPWKCPYHNGRAVIEVGRRLLRK